MSVTGHKHLLKADLAERQTKTKPVLNSDIRSALTTSKNAQPETKFVKNVQKEVNSRNCANQATSMTSSRSNKDPRTKYPRHEPCGICELPTSKEHYTSLRIHPSRRF